MGNIHVVGPNEALIISGGCCGSSSKRFITGGWAWTCCLVSDIQKLTLEVFTLTPKCEKIESRQGVPISVNAIAQCKIDKARIATAAEMFLGKDLDYIKSVVLQTIEGHLRAVTGTLEMEQIYLERSSYANLVTEMANKDLENFGIALLSFTIKEISDRVEYLTSMGRKDIAKTKHKAAIDVATYERDFKIKESEAELSIKEVQFSNQKEIEEQNKLLKTETEKQQCEVNKKRTEAGMAYGLESAKIRQEIAKERKNVELEETNLKLATLQNELAQKDLDYFCDIILPAKSEAYRLQKEAEASRHKKLTIAKAESEKTKKLAEAYSKVLKLNGEAQAEFMKNRASAFKSYNDAALLQLTLTALPKITAEICAPFKNIDEIVLVNGPSNAQASLASNFSSESARLASELPPVVKALTGVSLTRALDNIINIAPNNYLPLNQPGNFQEQKQNDNQSNSSSNRIKNFNKSITESKKANYDSQSINSISLINNPQTVKSSKLNSSSSSVSNLSNHNSNRSSIKNLLTTKPKSISNLSIHTVK